MKQILLTIFLSVAIIIAHAQPTISPSFNNEYCPHVEYTFTVTITKPYSGMSAINGCYITQLPASPVGTTFTFKGKFDDANKKQTFRIIYTDKSSTDFEFRRIKSLLFGACLSIQPNRSSITADLCQTPSFGINFSNLQWNTEFESPKFCFGAITTYEYLLPNNWSLNGTPSTGSWMAANNNVTVTADAVTGNGQAVQIRAVNTACGSGLQVGNPISIPVSRPAPPLSITGSPTLCYPNSYTYTLNGVPAGSTISWSNTNSYYNLIPGGNTATVTPNSAANGSTTINATVTLSCGLSFPVSTTVAIGTPYVTFTIESYPYEEPNCYEVEGIYTFRAVQATGYPNTFTGYDWGWRNLTTGAVSNQITIFGSQYTFIPDATGTYEIWVRATNQCGSGILESVKTVTVNNFCIGMHREVSSPVLVYPNPAKDIINVSVAKKAGTNKAPIKNKVVIELYEAITAVKVKEWKFDAEQEVYSLHIKALKKGTYYIRYMSGENKVTKQVIVE